MRYGSIRNNTGNLFEIDRASWEDDALCAETDPEIFFPEKGESTKAARRVCGICPVRDECLELAIVRNEQVGIFGGLSRREREQVVQQRAEQLEQAS